MTPALAMSPAKGLARHTDLVLAGMVVAVIVMMALPLPPWSLDMLVALNIAIGVVILLVALFIPSPLAFSTFPSVLLITTLFRISLSVATTRQILLHAHAGDIIAAFGKLVVGGSLVVGIVVFLIITIVQFIVIAKGAERVAEVGARFTLDALPGKQMSIDADVRAGLITQAEAVVRRNALIKESQFYGAMDGAMKFVKGDAIAGIVIVLVNLLGGITIGTLSMNLSFGAAIQKFSILTIGDGLVTQIPALFLSIAAGIAITRNEPEGAAHLGEQIGRQLGSQPRALMLGAGVMALFSLVPGFPTFTFLGLAVIVGSMSILLVRSGKAAVDAKTQIEVIAAAREGELVPMLLQKDSAAMSVPAAFKLDLSEALVQQIGAQQLNAALAHERARLRDQYGIPFPGLDLSISSTLAAQTFAVSVQGLIDTTVVVPADALLIIPKTRAQALDTVQAVEAEVPSLLQPAVWIASSGADAAKEAGFETLSVAELVARSVILVVQKNPAAVLGVQEVRQMLREIEWRFPDLVKEAQAVMPLPRLADLMTALAREQIPLSDLPGLLQAIVTNTAASANSGELYEKARLALARGIVARQMSAGQTKLTTVEIDPEFEAKLRSALVERPDGSVLTLDPAVAETARKALQNSFKLGEAVNAHTLVIAGDLRRAVNRLFRGSLPGIRFISHEEISASGAATDIVATSSLKSPELQGT
jgi:type III secretion protein V